MKPKTSEIWHFFTEVDGNFAKCNNCGKNYSRKGRTTTSLKRHLKSMHKELYEKLCALEEQREVFRYTTFQQSPGQLSSGESSNSKICVKEESQSNSIICVKEESQSSTIETPLWNTSNPEATKMDIVIAEMLVLENLPFHFVEGNGFRRVMQTALPNYHMRGHQFFTEHICNEMYCKIATKIGQTLQNLPKLSFTTNIWLNPSANESLLNITAHAIATDFTRIQIVLKCCLLHSSHTGNVIYDNFEMMLRDWDIQMEQLHCFVRDGTSIVGADAEHLGEIPHINCPVYQLQQCVCSALEWLQVKDLVAKCKEISAHFQISQMAQEELTKIQWEQFDQPQFDVLQDTDDGWISTFQMMKQLLKIKDSFCMYARNHNSPQLSPEEWSNLNKLVSVLTPLEEITRNLTDTTTCISSVIPLMHILKHTLMVEKEKSDTNPSFQKMIEKLVEDINSKFNDLPSNPLYSLATYLDPRYKLKFFNEKNKELVQAELIRLLTLQESRGDDESGLITKKATFESNPMTAEPNTTFHNWSATQSVHSNLADFLTNSSDDENDSTVASNNLMTWKMLISEYNKESRLVLDQDPLLWWSYNVKYAILNQIVRSYLSVPASSATRQQLFTTSGLLHEPLRNCLQGEQAEKLFFIKYNLPLLNFDYE